MQQRLHTSGARRAGESTPLQLNIKYMICNYTPAPHTYVKLLCFCAAVAPRQWRSPRRGARRVGEPTSLQPNTAVKTFGPSNT